MSPVSRRRKPKKTRTRKRRKVAASNASAASAAPPTFVDNAVRIVAGISDCDDPLQAEFLTAALLSDRSDLTDFLAHKLVPAIAERDAPDAVALVLDEAEDDERWPGYHALALLLHRWLESMPESDRPPASHGRCARPQGASSPLRRKKLPAARTEADGPTPVFQLRVSLTGSRPPIWRRIEVPADITLDELHGVIQVAFEWDDYHPYAFVTDYGVFGPPDSALPVRSDESVTLEQVAPGETATIHYLYDFEDCWEHDIVVEKIVKPEPGLVYPRCASGRCAAPPEESGGMQSYLDLLAILDDPDHPEHANTLDRFELDSAEEFDPTWFHSAAVNWALGALR